MFHKSVADYLGNAIPPKESMPPVDPPGQEQREQGDDVFISGAGASCSFLYFDCYFLLRYL